VRWVVEANVHTATAYHPANGGRPLRIPEGAAPWDTGYLVEPGQTFEVALTAEGVYDYFCAPHEVAGMVGRIIVGRPGGPGARPPGEGVPPLARAAFPSVERIMAEGIVRPSGLPAHASAAFGHGP
jgi:plastocyanin